MQRRAGLHTPIIQRRATYQTIKATTTTITIIITQTIKIISRRKKSTPRTMEVQQQTNQTKSDKTNEIKTILRNKRKIRNRTRTLTPTAIRVNCLLHNNRRINSNLRLWRKLNTSSLQLNWPKMSSYVDTWTLVDSYHLPSFITSHPSHHSTYPTMNY